MLVLAGGFALLCLALLLHGTTSVALLAALQLMIAIIAAYGASRRDAENRWGWWVLAASCAVGLLSNVSVLVPSADGVWAAFVVARYALFIVGLIGVRGALRKDPHKQSVLDAAIIAIGLTLVSWAFLVQPRVAEHPPDPSRVWVTITFAVLDLVMLTIVVRIVASPLTYTAATLLFAATGAVIVVSDILEITRIGVHGLRTFEPDGVTYFVWQLCGVVIAAAALHRPRRHRLARREPEAHYPRAQLITLMAVTVLGPVVPVVAVLGRGDILSPRAVVPIAGVAALACLLIVLLVIRQGNYARLAMRRASELNSQATAMFVQAEALRQAHREQQALQDELSRVAQHDPLTGLANRSVFAESLTRLLGDPRSRPVALLLIDVDGFKAVNDALGHATGDELLIRVARRLNQAAEDTDFVARLGADEFAVLLSGKTVDRYRYIAAEMIESIRVMYVAAEQEPRVTASGGLLIVEGSRVQPADALRNADLALYAAKQAGRNCLVEFKPHMREAHTRHTELAADVRSAIAEHALKVEYQPIVDITTGRTVALEALLRYSPSGRHISPSQFIAVAEDIGLVGNVGAEVLRDAASHARGWHRKFGVSVSVNVSGRQLASESFVEEVLDALDDAGVPPIALIIEITETVLVDAASNLGEMAIQSLHTLRDNGVRIAVDDFGTGFSSLAYLQRLPIDILKLDQMFTADLNPDDERGMQFVGAILELGRSLGLPTVAEGVETREQATLLRKLGCPLAQGYHFARPCPAESAVEFLSSPYAPDVHAARIQESFRSLGGA
jgi:diguanylate cyclase